MEATAGTALATRSSSDSSLSCTGSPAGGGSAAVSGRGSGSGGRTGADVTTGAGGAAARGSAALLRHHAGRAIAAPRISPTATRTRPFRAGDVTCRGGSSDPPEPAGEVAPRSLPPARDDPHRHDSTRDGTRRPHVAQSQLEESEGDI